MAGPPQSSRQVTGFKYGQTIRLMHRDSRRFLASLPQPNSYPGASGQYRVFATLDPSSYTLWEIRLPFSQDQPNIARTDDVLHGDRIRLFHRSTQKCLYCHPSHIGPHQQSNRQFEVTVYEQEDQYSNWGIIASGGPGIIAARGIQFRHAPDISDGPPRFLHLEDAKTTPEKSFNFELYVTCVTNEFDDFWIPQLVEQIQSTSPTSNSAPNPSPDQSSPNPPPTSDAPVESDDSADPAESAEPPESFSNINEQDFTRGAWLIIDIARRMSAGREQSRTSVRRLMASMLMVGQTTTDDNTAGWLVTQSSLDREAITKRLSRSYPIYQSMLSYVTEKVISPTWAQGYLMTADLKRTLDFARQLAIESQLKEGPALIGIRHLLGAVIRFNRRDTIVDRYLGGYGINLDIVLAELLKILPTFPDAPDAWRRLLDVPTRQSAQPAGPNAAANLINSMNEMSVDSAASLDSLIPNQANPPFGPWNAIPASNAADDISPPDRGYARLDPDNPQGEDKLNITNDVNALARMIAAWKLEPPLAVGLFGEWGSGKTFFMTKLRLAVADLSKKARERKHTIQKDEAYCKYIAQVEFNAWHYSEGDLWAGMVHHIFTNLRLTDDESETELAKRTASAMTAIKVAEGVAAQKTQDLEQSQAQVLLKETEKLQAEQDAQDAVHKLRVTSGDIVNILREDPQLKTQVKDLLDKAGLDSKAIQTAEDVTAAAQNASKDGATALGLLKQLGRDLRERPLRVLAVYSLIIGFPFLIAYAIKSLQFADKSLELVVKSVLSLAPTIVTAATYFSTVTQRLAHALDEPRRKIMEEQRKKLAQLQIGLDESRAREAAARKAASDAAAKVDEAKRELESLTPEHILSAFLMDKAASAFYRDKLGMLAVVRGDFERLSRLMMDQHKKDLIANPSAAVDEKCLRLNRIILYIDDLDRCPPERVVQVLQAVHLLLAFPLFVVVVGVDARWVQRSLRRQYQLLLSTDNDGGHNGNPASSGLETIATPRDYLEKIFQIPLWLRSMSDPIRKDLVRSLISADAQEESKPATIQSETPKAETDSQINGPVMLPDPNPPPRGIQAVPVYPANVTVSPAPPQVQNLPPSPPLPPEPPEQIDHLRLDPRETEIMATLSPLYGRSPRSIKRYINCYRLFRSMLSAEYPDNTYTQPLAGGGFRYEISLLLMAIVVGAPTIARQIVQIAMLLANNKEKLRPILERLISSPQSSDVATLEALSIRPFVNLIPEQIDIESARDLIFRAWRFSFRSAEPLELTKPINSATTEDAVTNPPQPSST